MVALRRVSADASSGPGVSVDRALGEQEGREGELEEHEES